MSLTSYQKAKVILDMNPDYVSMSGPKLEEVVHAGEAALSLRFPPTYRQFVKEYGTLTSAGEEIYGITGPDNEISSVPNAVWLTLTERRQAKLPSNYVILYSTGDGDYSCLAVNGERDEDCPVVTFFPGTNREPVLEASSFGDWFANLIQQALEDILLEEAEVE